MDHRDVLRDAAVREEAILGQRQADVIRLAMYASDAWVGALPDEAEDAHRRDHHQVSWDEGAGKLAGRVLDGRASDACP
jgi:hypothetical protein